MKQNIQLAWFAGLYEGEGHIRYQKSNRGTMMMIAMTDKDVVERALKVAKVGRVIGPRHDGNPKHKPRYDWICTKRNDIFDLVKKIKPFLGQRRLQQAENTIRGLKRLKEPREFKTVANCGFVKRTDITNKGQKRHLARGEKPCEDCMIAQRNYMRKWRKAFYEANK